jgi:hypothetical protein
MRSKSLIKDLLVLLLVFFFPLLTAYGQIDFPLGSNFRYLKGINAAGLSSQWMNAGFDDAGWSVGNAPIRYGDGTGGTVLDDMQNNYSVVYMRTSFTVQQVDLLDNISLLIDYDDGFVIWINGKRVFSQYAPAILSHDGFATDLHESGVMDSVILEPDIADLVEGENTLAIQGFNYNLESTDFLMDIGFHADVIEPVLQDSVGLSFSFQSGFYNDPFYLEIVPSDPAWRVVYTLDGSNPQDSETAFVEEDMARILVDPNSSDGRPQTPVFVVRASSAMDGIKSSMPETRTFIFLDEVLQQDYPGGEWPTEPVNNQVIDLAMDSRIVTDPSYQNEMIHAMTDIPSISVITDLDNLFDPETGIYVNAYGHGFEWERECSVELLYPDGSEGFNVNAGLRIRGGWSRHPEFPKHAFRLFFRSEYGDAKLDYPLFGDEGVDRFDKIDLRTAQNWAWTHPGDPSHNTFLRDVFSRDTQRDMGQPYTRSKFYHLYLNGMYWGLFQTQERSEARFAADYLGGNTDDYDVIKVNTEDWLYQIEVTDGNINTWFDLWGMCEEGFSDNASYFNLLGMDEQGSPKEGGQVYLDMDNLIDYMLSIFYTANFDAPTSSFMGNRRPNNFFAIFNREDQSKGFTFYNHDAEHSLFAEMVGPGQGLNEDRVNLAMVVEYFGAFHPQWLHHKLTDNAEYRMRFMDRAYKHLEGEGALIYDNNLMRLETRASEIEKAIIGESARWGDAKPNVTEPYTKNDDWVPEVNKIRNDFLPYRGDIVIGQLDEAGLYPTMDAPVCSLEGLVLHDEMVPVSGPGMLLLENPNSTGTIWYTTDGTDPRSVGGSVAPNPQSGGADQVEINFGGSAVVKARIQYGNDWSALKEVHLMAEQQDYSDLAVTELHYHPQEMVVFDDTTESKDLEFIEFKNMGQDAINLSGLVLDSAIYYEFPEDALLPPQQFYVVASKPSAFYERYGLIASGNFQKNLSNGGEEVLLRDQAGNPVIHFIYSDDFPWPVEADGEGYSLVSTLHDPTGFPGNSSYWKSSRDVGGSPFHNDPDPVNIHPADVEQAEIMVYPNPTSGLLYVKWPDGIIPGETSLQLYGLNGNLLYVRDLYGSQSIQLDQLNLSPGVYIVKISTPERSYMKKIIYR